MKKRWIFLVVLMVCLAFTACSGADSETTKKALSMYEKYGDLLEMLEKENYQGAISHLAGLVAEKNKEEQGETPSLLTQVFGGWYLLEEGAGGNAFAQVSFAEDGTCRLGEKELSWVKSGEGDDYVNMRIYEAGEVKYTASFSLTEYSNVMSLNISVSGDSTYNGTYYRHSIFNFMDGWWRVLDTSLEVKDREFDIYPRSNVAYGDVRYMQNVISYDDEKMEISLYRENMEKPEYHLTMTFRGDYPIMEVKDYASGEVVLYYREESGKSDTWPEVLYGRAIKVLNDVADGSGAWVDWPEDKSLTHNEALAYAMDLLKQCGDYKDSADRIAKFTVLEDKLVEIIQEKIDNLGNVSSNQYAKYQYDKNNNRYYTYDLLAERLYYGKFSSRDGFEYEYDANGRIVKIYDGSATRMEAIITPAYDADGNMISIYIQTNSGEWINYFTYENGKMTSAKYYEINKPDEVKWFLNFAYDDDGNLISEEGLLDYNYHYQRNYIYDEVGRLIREEYEYQQEFFDKKKTTETYVHTYDSEGKLIATSIEVSNSTNKSLTLSYVYDTLYFYEFEAE